MDWTVPAENVERLAERETNGRKELHVNCVRVRVTPSDQVNLIDRVEGQRGGISPTLWD